MTTVDNIAGPGIADKVVSPEVREARARLRALSLKGISLFLVIVVAAYGTYEWLTGSSIVSTDDAYVGTVLAQVTPQIDGTISDIQVQDTQYVHKGDVLVELDPRDAELDYQSELANFDEAVRKVRKEIADANGEEANVSAKQALVAQAEQQLGRRTSIRQPGIVAAEEISNSRSAVAAAKYALSIAEHELAAQRAIVSDVAIDSNPEVLAAKAALERTKLHLERTQIRAPVDGIVAESQVQIGQRISAGTELMTVVPIRQLFVDANFKESQITQIRPGQLVTLTSDVFGSSRVFHGYVEGIGGGTGAAFAIIPPQNATGNWIKVVQRLPIRIALNPDELSDNPLRVGISMTVDVHLNEYVDHSTRTAALPQPVSLRAASTGVY